MAEHGFYHPDRGYWQAIEGSVEDLLPTYPEGTINVSLKPSGDHEWQDGEWVYVESPPPPAPVIVLYPVDLWSRLTNDEAEQVEGAMLGQPIRLQNIFRAASSYRSDHELWPLLQSIAVALFGDARAAEILAAS